MSLDIGRKGWIGVALQSGYDVPANISDYVPFMNNTLQGKQEQIEVKHATGVRDAIATTVAGKRMSEGQVDINMDSKFAGYFLVAALGTVQSTSLGSSVYEHAITENQSNTPQYLSAVAYRVKDRSFYPNVAVDELTIDNQLDLAMMKMKLNGSFPSTTASGSLTMASGNLFTFKNSQFAFGNTVAEAANNPNLKPHDYKLTIKNNTDPIHRHGSNDPASINHKQLDVDAEFQLYFEGTTERDDYYNQEKQAGCWRFLGAGIGGGYQEEVKFNLYQISYKDWDLETGLENFYVIKGKLNGEYDFANSKTIDALVRNNKASYI